MNVKRLDDRARGYARHEHSGWAALALVTTEAPLWHRVTSLAYGFHRANGHATFKPGEIGILLAMDPRTGEVGTPPQERSLRKAIETAVSYGLLETGSCLRCLIVPTFVSGGPDARRIRGWENYDPSLGPENAPCSVHADAGSVVQLARQESRLGDVERLRADAV